MLCTEKLAKASVIVIVFKPPLLNFSNPAFFGSLSTVELKLDRRPPPNVPLNTENCVFLTFIALNQVNCCTPIKDIEYILKMSTQFW